MRSDLIFLHFFVPICLINLSININVVTSHCLVHQQLLLLQMKGNLTFNPAKSQKLVHWNQSVDCCRWNGVSCKKGLVVGLDLNHEFISKGLDNSSLFHLQHLHSLNLAYNDFGSLIPSKIEKLKNLRHLNLSNAGFHGQIPNEISHLTRLTTLDLSTSFASQHTLKLEKMNMGMLLQNLTQITELYLDGVMVYDAGKEWRQALSSLQKLQVLSMSSCNLSGPIDPSLAKLQSLQVIRLNLNSLSGSVPESFANLSHLTTLDLSSCNLRGVFPKGIFQIQTLKVLDVSDNQDLQGFLPNFPQDGYLDTLNLSYTNFSGQLVSAISNLKQLSTLDLSYCQFSGTLPISLFGLTQLVHLDLSFNNFTGPLSSFNNSKDLKYLYLNGNEFVGVIPSTHWEGLSNLRIIKLGYNFFNGKVPTTLFTLPSLQELSLSHNGFEGHLDEFHNASLVSSLEFVDLSINKLQGPIPVSLFHLKRLSFLQLSLNKFNGTIKLGMIFQRLPHLQTLGLSNNNLSVDTTVSDDLGPSSFPSLLILMLASCNLREFPSFLRKQSQLLALDLSINRIQGIIPNWVWKLESLVYLNISDNLFTDLEGHVENSNSSLMMIDLHSNQIHGSVPFLAKYTAHFDYSNNRFNFIPDDITKYLGFTNFLSLSNNSFHGQIPESFCNSYTLRLLDLSHNNFDGFIPECLIESSTLRVLNLAGNKLTGHIADAFSSSSSLRFLDLSSNLLGGTIPKSLGNCQWLELLNLGNNLLSGEFPCFLRNISTLRFLILRLNKLYGPIGCAHSTGNWEMLHIVDLSSNNFTGTIPGTLLQRWTAMMDDGNETRENTGYLFFDLYDFHHSVHYRDMLAIISNGNVKRFLELLVVEHPSTVENLYSFFASANQLQSGGTFLDSVIVVNKGLQMKFFKILNVFTSLDLSCNNFEGPIPEELMRLNALLVLNLSHNAFSSHIPSSLGNLTQLESLDLSNNSLIGEIPTEISNLHFLQVLNLSFNHLVGQIPTGTQIQSFEADSFEGNKGLCGPPLTKNCSDGQGLQPSPSATSEAHSSIGWKFLSAELGFTFGFGVVILPLIFWRRWRLWYCKLVDDLLWRIFPQLDFVYEQRGENRYRTLRWRR